MISLQLSSTFNTMNNASITNSEKRATFGVALIFAFRMLGLFMILPVFAIYVHNNIADGTPFLTGLALGIYGLTQCLLQIPFGMLSDHLGRKRIICLGLALFAMGSVVCALSHTILGLILGRALQGAGAIGSASLALIADLTKEENRTKAMAIVGMTIGVAFSIAFIVGPILNSLIGVPGIFWLTAIFAFVGIAILAKMIPFPKKSVFHRDTEMSVNMLKPILQNRELLRLDFGIFSLHAMLTATFLAVPITLQKITGVQEAHQWMIYLPVIVLAFFAMVPFIIIAEKKRKMKTVFSGAVLALVIAQLGLFIFQHFVILVGISLFIFFTAFSLLEASLPSLISKIAPTTSKGTAMGIYSSSQFLGIFIGGVVGGLVSAHFGSADVYMFGAVLALIWWGLARTMQKPPHFGTHMINVGQMTELKARMITDLLLSAPGVHEAVVMIDDGIAYLKVDNQVVNKDDLLHLVNQEVTIES